MSDGVTLVEVTKRYEDGTLAVDGVTLRVEPGEFVVVTGPSGSGKSTLLQLVAGLDTATSGCIDVAGVDVSSGRHLDRYRRHVAGVVFQLHNLLPHLTAEQNIEVAAFGSMRRDARVAAARDLLRRLGLSERARSRPPRMSGGERQRVAIARAVVNDPEVVLADEPTGSLDAAASEAVIDLLRERCDRGVCVLAVSHDERFLRASDRVLELVAGRIVATDAAKVSARSLDRRGAAGTPRG